MILALETGWLPEQIASLPARFRAACHWVLFIRTVLPDGISDVPITSGMTLDERLEAGKRRGALIELRSLIFPADE